MQGAYKETPEKLVENAQVKFQDMANVDDDIVEKFTLTLASLMSECTQSSIKVSPFTLILIQIQPTH
jgi:hypothetical protein